MKHSVTFFRWYFALLGVWYLLSFFYFLAIGGFLVILFYDGSLALGHLPSTPLAISAAAEGLNKLLTIVWAIIYICFAFVLPKYFSSERIGYIKSWVIIGFSIWFVLELISVTGNQISILGFAINSVLVGYLYLSLQKSFSLNVSKKWFYTASSIVVVIILITVWNENRFFPSSTQIRIFSASQNEGMLPAYGRFSLRAGQSVSGSLNGRTIIVYNKVGQPNLNVDGKVIVVSGSSTNDSGTFPDPSGGWDIGKPFCRNTSGNTCSEDIEIYKINSDQSILFDVAEETAPNTFQDFP